MDRSALQGVYKLYHRNEIVSIYIIYLYGSILKIPFMILKWKSFVFCKKIKYFPPFGLLIITSSIGEWHIDGFIVLVFGRAEYFPQLVIELLDSIEHPQFLHFHNPEDFLVMSNLMRSRPAHRGRVWEQNSQSAGAYAQSQAGAVQSGGFACRVMAWILRLQDFELEFGWI